MEIGLPLGLPLPFVRSPRRKVLQLSICLLSHSSAVALITSYSIFEYFRGAIWLLIGRNVVQLRLKEKRYAHQFRGTLLW